MWKQANFHMDYALYKLDMVGVVMAHPKYLSLDIVGSQFKICQSRTGVCCKNRARVFFHCMWFSVSKFFSTVATAPRA
jgi:hypothetical protein